MARFLVTGGAGFIGSNLVRALVTRRHDVRVVDDLSTGRRENIAAVLDEIEFLDGSICDKDLLKQALADVDYCLHQAAIPSVPRSIEHPWSSNRANVEGTLNVFLAARDAGVRRVVFASSSAVYGNATTFPVTENLPPDPLSPYGVTKLANELYARVFTSLYGMDIVGLRYFNVFGPRQDPNSQYSAAVPIFIAKLLKGERPPVHGDGLQSRDFTYVDNVVDANLRACEVSENIAGVYNIACDRTTSVLDLIHMLNETLGMNVQPEFLPARAGDIRQSWADISRARRAFGYEPVVSVREGLAKTAAWFAEGRSDA